MLRTELTAWLRLGETPGIGNEHARRLLAAFATPEAVFEARASALSQVVGGDLARSLLGSPKGFDALVETTWSWLTDTGADQAPRQILTLGDPAYPAALLAMADPPLMLYVLGRPLPGPEVGCIAIVGSRNPTPQGALDAEAFAQHFAACGLTVVSGLAQGIDGAAHRGALEGATETNPCATVAFVGTGLDRVYPPKNRALAHRIAAGGCLVSEYPLGTPPLPPNFPRRNRLIAGLSLGTLVVEAGQPSGSLITARLAVEQGKEVFAVPGSIHSPQSRGCHALIRQGAKLVESARDVMEELRLPVEAPARAGLFADEETRGAEDPLLEAMGHAPVGVDALVARTGIDPGTLQVRLLELELDGRVARLTGGLLQRIAAG
jgi:DNA processing protein